MEERPTRVTQTYKTGKISEPGCADYYVGVHTMMYDDPITVYAGETLQLAGPTIERR